jgi:hypothetical protein
MGMKMRQERVTAWRTRETWAPHHVLRLGGFEATSAEAKRSSSSADPDPDGP